MNEFTYSSDDYKNDLIRYVDELQSEVKSGETSIEQAIKITKEMTDAYVEQVGERPDNSVLIRLGTILLNDVYTDSSRAKSQVEYPVLSDTQLARRKSGAYQRSYSEGYGEASFSWADSIGIDGNDYRTHTRDNNRRRREKLRL